MFGQEKCVRITRASKKRSFPTAKTQSLQQLPTTKKRVVLGDLTNSVNAGLTLNSDTRKPRSKLKQTDKKKVKEVEESDNTEVSVGSSEENNTQKCSYAPFIYQHLHSLEVEEKRRPLSGYMEKVQKDVTPGMREILVDWLVEVAEEYRLLSDTLFLTVSYIDRFLSSHPLTRNRLQLVGVSSMLVASKYEEISPPHVEDLCYITDNTYTKEEVVDMERDILKFLNFQIGNPTMKTFLRIFTRAAQENSMSSQLQFEFLGCYLAELSLLDYGFVRYLPSMLAASVIFLSRFTIQPNKYPWSSRLQQYSGYKPSELKDCVLAIHDLQLSRTVISSRAVRAKYSQHKFKCVAELPPPSEIPSSYFEAVGD